MNNFSKIIIVIVIAFVGYSIFPKSTAEDCSDYNAAVYEIQGFDSTHKLLVDSILKSQEESNSSISSICDKYGIGGTADVFYTDKSTQNNTDPACEVRALGYQIKSDASNSDYLRTLDLQYKLDRIDYENKVRYYSTAQCWNNNKFDINLP